MELLAISAALEEEKRGEMPLENAFKRFLKNLCNIEKSNIILQGCYYNKSDIPPEILVQRPLLLDPVNPYNNLLGGECGYGYGMISSKPNIHLKEFMLFMSDAAGMCLEMIGNGCRHISMIFAPQHILCELRAKEKWLQPKNGTYLIGVHGSNDSQIDSEMMINPLPSYTLRDSELPEIYTYDIDAILYAYAGCIYNHVVGTKKNLPDKEIMDKMGEFVDKMDGKKRNWVASDDEHANKDITMYIPFEFNLSHSKYVVISFNFDIASK